VEDHEALETSAVIRELTDTVKDKIDDFLADGVVTTGVVVCRIFLAGDDLLGVIELAVSAGSHFITYTGFKIDVHGAGNVLASTSFGEKGVERVVAATNSLVRGHLTIGLDTVLKAVELPAAVTGLDTSLANVD